jgi:hypothetical protein
VVVNVSAAPTLVITPPSPPPSVGLPASFIFEVTAAPANGSAVRNVNVNWGDLSRTTDLGAVTGKAVVSHTYTRAETFVVTGTLTDAAGNSTAVSTSVTVVPVPRPGIAVSQSPNPGHAGSSTTLTIQVTVATGISVQDLAVNFGDNVQCACDSTAHLGGATSAVIPHIYTVVGSYIVTVTVLDSSGQTTIGTAVVSIAP